MLDLQNHVVHHRWRPLHSPLTLTRAWNKSRKTDAPGDRVFGGISYVKFVKFYITFIIVTNTNGRREFISRVAFRMLNQNFNHHKC